MCMCLFKTPAPDACTHMDDVRDYFPQGRVGIKNNDSDELSAAAKMCRACAAWSSFLRARLRLE